MKTRQQQIDEAMKTAKGLQKTLVKSVKSGDIEGEVLKGGKRVGNKQTTPAEEAGDTYDPEASASRINNFSSALNVAIDHARQQRKDKTMDFMNGVVPPGALPATSFAGVLSAFNTDSAPLESSLITGASNHAISQEEQKMKIAEDAAQALKDTQNSIRELALTAGKNGAKQETIDAIMELVESGDIDAAIKVGGAALSSIDDNIHQVGSNLVSIDPETKEVTVLYSAPQSSGGDGGSDKGANETGFFKSGSLKIDNNEIGIGAQNLEQLRGDDGHTDSAVYSQMFDTWVSQGGLPQDFFNKYDPDYYLNPNDPSVPIPIKSQMAQPKKEATKKSNAIPEYGTPAYYEWLLNGSTGE